MLKFKLIAIFFLLGILNGNCISWSQTLQAGFKALETHDYFKAKKSFDRHKKRNKALAALGLAQLYTRPQNIFQNVDSAHLYIQIALENFQGVNARKIKRYMPFGFEKSKMELLRQQISSVLFEQVIAKNTEEDFITFINGNLWAKEIPIATFYRDSLAFHKYLSAEHSTSMTLFLKKYPTSVFADRAQQQYFKFQYAEQTQSKQREDYEKFLKNFPESPYTKDADRALFKLAEDVNTIQGYEKFLELYPKSSHRADVWRLLYRAYIKQNGLALVNEFKKQYNNYPFMADLELELSLLNTQLFPAFLNGKWGYMDKIGQLKIEPKFDYVELFSQGRAVAQTDDLYGFIDVIGNWIIRPQFTEVTPFRYNLSVVIDTNEKVGAINLFGEWVLESRFDDVQIINDDWLWVKDDSGWILYQISKNKFSQEHFSQAGEFIDGLAIVSSQSEFALIDLQGNKLLSFEEKIERFGDLYSVRWNDSNALITELNEPVLPYNNYIFGTYNAKGLTPFLLNGLIGYLDRYGKVVISNRLDTYPNWQTFAGFVNNHAKVYQQKSKKFGLIDLTGNFVLPPKYNDISFFSDVIAVQTNEKWEYINKNGQRMNIGTFDRAESFVDSAGIVVSNGLYGLIGIQGQELLPNTMKRLLRLTDQLLLWEDENGKMWLGNNRGEIILDQPSDKIDLLDDSLIQFVINQEVFYYLITEQKIVSKK